MVLSTSELDRVIVSNLQDLDTAASRIVELGALVWRELGRHAQDWGSQRGWAVTVSDSDIYLKPSEWGPEAGDGPHFYLGWGPDDGETGEPNEPMSWLARFVGVSGGQLCLWLDQAAGARTWKPIANAAAATLAPFGFRLSDAGNFYAVCTLDGKVLGEALADGRIPDSFAPIETALSSASQAVATFTPLLTKADQL